MSATGPIRLVCFALSQEAVFFVPPDDLPGTVVTLITGVGRTNATKAFTAALERESPNLVLTCGFAGALRDDLPVGTLIFNRETDGLLGQILEKIGARPCQFYCSSRIAATAVEKEQIRKESGADAVEMESGAIQELCWQAKIPCVTLRSISDEAGRDMPTDFNQFMTQEMNLDYTKLAWSVAKAPHTLRGLLRLQRECKVAAKSLGAAISELLRMESAGRL